MNAMKPNQPGHVDAVTGRMAITLAQEKNRPDPDLPAYWFNAELHALGLDGWRVIDGIDSHVSVQLADVWFENGDMVTMRDDECIYITKKEAALMKRIYIAGPMTGHPDLNFPAFHAAAAELRAQGHHVENPAEINADPSAKWLDCMRMDIARLVTCDAVHMLPGWEKSRGANVEHGLAVDLGLNVTYAEGGVNAGR